MLTLLAFKAFNITSSKTSKAGAIVQPEVCASATGSFSKKGDSYCFSISPFYMHFFYGEQFKIEGYDESGKLVGESETAFGASFPTVRVINMKEGMNQIIPLSIEVLDPEYMGKGVTIKQRAVLMNEWEGEISGELTYYESGDRFEGNGEVLYVSNHLGADITVTPDPSVLIQCPEITNKDDHYIKSEITYETMEFMAATIATYVDRYENGKPMKSSAKIAVKAKQNMPYSPETVVEFGLNKFYEHDNPSKLSGGEIAGIVIACVVVVGVVVFCIVWFVVLKKGCCKGKSVTPEA